MQQCSKVRKQQARMLRARRPALCINDTQVTEPAVHARYFAAALGLQESGHIRTL